MPGMKGIATGGPVSRASTAKSGMKKMATGGTTSRPRGIEQAMQRVEKSAADRALDRLAGIKEGSAKDIRADKMQAKNLMAGKPQVNGGVKAAYGVKKMMHGGTMKRGK